ncbi:LAME_0E05138g1_1 [Lachancea meyersii CBS 8951]|uniref:LAME_0E05138g1_1 n=1 Tax=Lachancea meyersii CBS 8951 TaxID=1266667 RepID=A0A1G4JH82_9SACH|nr:LAME_0E05138g1_1 [Lachancea meyersii CBS 8951]
MEDILSSRLQERDVIEKNFAELFETASALPAAHGPEESADPLTVLRKELAHRERQIEELLGTLKLKNKDTERLNDEIITLNIENNLLHDRYDKIKVEHDEIVARWLKKAQLEADTMNESLV